MSPEENLKLATVEQVISGTAMIARVSPCAWMYEHYPFQITVHLKDVPEDTGIVTDPTLSFNQASPDDIARLLEQARVCTCPKCSRPTLIVPSTPEPNARECYACRMKEATAAYEAEVVRERKRQETKNRAARKKGYRYRVDAIVHCDGGDDQQVYAYFVDRPTDGVIRKMLRDRGSVVLDHFCVSDLSAVAIEGEG